MQSSFIREEEKETYFVSKWPLLLKWLAIRHRQFDFVSD